MANESEVKVTVKAEDRTGPGTEQIRENFKRSAEEAKTFGNAMAEAFKKPEDDLSGLKNTMDSWISTLGAATSKNQEYATQMAQITKAYKDGKMGADDAREGIEKIKAAMEAGSAPAESWLSKFKGAAGPITDAAASIAKFAAVGAVAIGAVKAISEPIRQAVSDYMNYALAMDKLSLVMGTSVEETSRLVQVADDFRVEQSTMETAMKMAAQNGYAPSIDLIARMADKFNSIVDPAQRAAAMQEVFGRQWAEMTPLLEQGGQAIRDAAAAMDAGMVITGQEAAEAVRAAKAIDDWNDSWTAYKNTLASEVLPVMTAVLEKNAMFNQARSQGMGRTETQAYVKAMTEAKKADEDWASSEREAMVARKAATKTIEQEAGATLETTGAVNRYDQLANRHRATILQSNSALKAQEENYRRVSDLAADLNNATRQLGEAQDQLNENYGSKAAAALSKYAGEGKKYREGLAIQDKVLGTNMAAQYDAQKAMDELAQKFATGKITADEYAKGLEAQKGPWEALDKNILNAKTDLLAATAAFNNFTQTLTAANGMHFSVNVDVNSSGGGGGGTGVTGTSVGGTSSGSGCFVAGTLVNVPGGMKPIEDICMGDEVITLTNNGPVTSRVVKLITVHRADTVLVTTNKDKAFHCSPNHRFLTKRGWVEAVQLDPFDELVALEDGTQVIGLWPIDGEYQVYNFEVDHPDHTYMVGGVVVHNGKATGGPVFTGRAYMVGEQGPEMFVPTQSGNIVNNSSLRAGGAAGITINGPITVVANNPQQFVAGLGKATKLASLSGAAYAGG